MPPCPRGDETSRRRTRRGGRSRCGGAQGRAGDPGRLGWSTPADRPSPSARWPQLACPSGMGPDRRLARPRSSAGVPPARPNDRRGASGRPSSVGCPTTWTDRPPTGPGGPLRGGSPVDRSPAGDADRRVPGPFRDERRLQDLASCGPPAIVATSPGGGDGLDSVTLWCIVLACRANSNRATA